MTGSPGMSIITGIISRLTRAMPRVRFHSLSEKGPVRRENQDNLYVSPDKRLFCVADGMGGGEGGAKASEIVCRAIAAGDAGTDDFASRLRGIDASIAAANSDIREFARKAGYHQMATTVSALLFDDNAESAAIGYVGDSRVYRYRGGKMSLLTHDHTVAGEIERHTMPQDLPERFPGGIDRLSHILTRAVGIEEGVCTEWRKIDVQDGDMYLVCTDGVYDMAGPDAMESAFASSRKSCKGVVAALAKKIVDAGAVDNYTMIVARVDRGG